MPEISAGDICTAALTELQAIAQGETPSAGDMSWALQKLNRLVDNWATRRQLVYNVNFNEYTLTPNLQPHTIGPAEPSLQVPNFTVPVRPVKIINANIVITSVSPDVRYPLYLMNDDEWAAISVRQITVALPEALYYSTDWPLGKLYLWPIPNIAYKLELETWTVISQFTKASDKFSLPPGYWDAVVYSLAEELIPSFPNSPSGAAVSVLAKRARGQLAQLNSKSPKLRNDAPSSGRGGYFNHWSGLIEPR
jgi:hypothetical protein